MLLERQTTYKQQQQYCVCEMQQRNAVNVFVAHVHYVEAAANKTLHRKVTSVVNISSL